MIAFRGLRFRVCRVFRVQGVGFIGFIGFGVYRLYRVQCLGFIGFRSVVGLQVVAAHNPARTHCKMLSDVSCTDRMLNSGSI